MKRSESTLFQDWRSVPSVELLHSHSRLAASCINRQQQNIIVCSLSVYFKSIIVVLCSWKLFDTSRERVVA